MFTSIFVSAAAAATSGASAAPVPGTPGSVGDSAVAVMGFVSLLVAMLVAAWCVLAGIAGNARGNRRLVQSSVYGLYAFTAIVALSSALIIYAFVTHDFSIKYVSATSDTSMSMAYKVTAFWGGLDGSLLFWVLVLALFSAVAIKVNHRRHRDMIGYVVATIMVIQIFFLALLLFGKNPFATHLTDAPVDGKCLNPLLQNYWMVIHPPSLYTGFVAATIPFAFAIGALASGRLDDMWLGSVRVWTLICFFFLSLGLILGGRWAYEELGWGGYWAWDPVENAGFLPWFTATAFLHSAIIQEQRGMLKTWNMVLVVTTFFLTIFGTFMTRAGVVQSVHAFGEDNELAVQFIVFMIVILVVSIGLIAYRSSQLSKAPQLESFFSREVAFLVNNWILLGCAFFVLFATMFPTISEAIDGSRVSVGIGFFNRWMVPLGLILLLLAGVAPLLAWRRTTGARLLQHFLWPAVTSVVVVILLAVLVPPTRAFTPVFGKSLLAPMPLITYAFCAFVWTSVVQEFIRGVIVRRKQTGSDPLTSLIGLVLTKRRKYGGYFVHVGIGILFLGFSGKTYEQMDYREATTPAVLAPGEVPKAGAPGVFTFGDYVFAYEDLIQSQDDSKDAVTAKVSLWQDGEKLAVLYPARWDFHCSEQPSTEVAIHSRLGEDVYLVLTGFGQSAQGLTGGANFQIFKNPLILWVWVGYITLALGTLICLIPAGLVNLVSRRPTSTIGRMADVAAVILFFGGSVIGIGMLARPSLPQSLRASSAVPACAAPRDPAVSVAPTPDVETRAPAGVLARAGLALGQAGAEHDTSPGMGDDGTSHADKHRPTSPTGAALMHELVCMCGGCQRETLFDCKCAYAASERAEVNKLLAGADLSTEAARKAAYDKVIAAFVSRYGGDKVLSTPRSSLSWMLPMLAAIGGLLLLGVVARRWVKRGRAQLAAAGGTRTAEVPLADQPYADRLDDELRDTD
jgi:cytochrome c-type biogenesis protein CcmF